MDPITAFATIVSLLADFVAHRSANEGKSFDEFMAWLSEQRHDEIRSLLELNTNTTIGIKALLGENQKEILDRLNSLDRQMAGFAAGFDSYRSLAQAAHPTAGLSPQAISLLEQFYDSGASEILEIQVDSSTALLFVDGPTSGNLQVSDPRFIQDDLTTLVEAGLLSLGHNGKGQRMYSFKRTAARLVESRRVA